MPTTPDTLGATRLIFGCGYLGRRVAARWRSAGHSVAALTRGNGDPLRALGLAPITGDVLDPTSLRALPAAATVLYAVGLDRSAGKTMREVYVTGLGNVLDALPPGGRFIYISSTSVYGQSDGGWVEETSATEPATDSGRVVLEAEQLLRAKRPDAIVLRFAGIYGPDRLLRRQSQLMKEEPITGDAHQWLNLIHVEDGADAVLAAEQYGEPGATYNVADDAPVSRREFYTLLAELLGAPAPRFEERPEPDTANRRVSNRAACERLRWSPRHPSYREGVPSAVRAEGG
jgi:nucleoside-diphosphate-sugar epimerase